MKKHLVFIIVLLISLPLFFAQIMLSNEAPPSVITIAPPKEEPAVNPHLQTLIDEYDQQINLLQLTGNTPGAAIAVVKDSSIVFLKTFGVKEAGTEDSVDVNTVFRIASVSKCFASFLTGILVQDGTLGWHDQVVRYVPDFELKSPEQTKKLSVQHVLSHTTGLPFHAYTNLVEEGLVLTDMLSRLKDVELSGRVGQTYSYQNVAYSLIGEVIKSATGKSYEAWMIEKVFGPLNMKNASIDYFSMITNENTAKPHVLKKGGWKKAAITNTYYNVSPAGGVNASISDMANWMIALLGYRPDVIHSETLDRLFTPVTKAPSKNRNYGRLHKLNDSYYGLGWRILHYPNDTLVYHGGYVNGYRSEVAVNKKHNIAICILANSPGELADNGIPLFFNLFKEHQEEIARWEKEENNRIQLSEANHHELKSQAEILP